ncbi:Uncharacterised protein [Vibrio cholerae]|nr:Uncharacterised protein [Vibrio cholerae]CSD25278.1 Uncharacterised protein [Vibrio cholerae]
MIASRSDFQSSFSLLLTYDVLQIAGLTYLLHTGRTLKQR